MCAFAKCGREGTGCTLSAPAQSPSAASAWRGCARAPPATHRKGRLAVAGSWAAQTLARKPSVRPDHSPFSALSLTCVCPPLPSPPASDASDHAVRRPLPSPSQQQAQPLEPTLPSNGGKTRHRHGTIAHIPHTFHTPVRPSPRPPRTFPSPPNRNHVPPAVGWTPTPKSHADTPHPQHRRGLGLQTWSLKR